MANFRAGRIKQEIQREVNDILAKRVKDPRVANVNITDVEITGDLQQATIYYSTLSELASDREKTQLGLDKATGLVRKELGTRLTLYKTPELIFKRDESVAYGSKIDELIRKMHEDEKKINSASIETNKRIGFRDKTGILFFCLHFRLIGRPSRDVDGLFAHLFPSQDKVPPVDFLVLLAVGIVYVQIIGAIPDDHNAVHDVADVDRACRSLPHFQRIIGQESGRSDDPNRKASIKGRNDRSEVLSADILHASG